nr:MAG TPA: hypothetical protein [Caudoviricetes sp.]DAS07043.1 MAG TPA: hypothetical protein [Caudoviricetes sp.]
MNAKRPKPYLTWVDFGFQYSVVDQGVYFC